MKHIFTFIGSLTIALCNAQAPEVVWDKYFGGQGGEAISIEKTLDGGFIIAGTAKNPHEDAVNFVGDPDVFVVKVNSEFEKEWSYCYGGQYFDEPSKIIQTSDGGYAFAATKSMEAVSFNAWIVKLDAVGQVVWEYNYGGSNEDWTSGIAETATGDFVVSGWSRSADGDLPVNKGFADYWILRLNNNGVLQQSNVYGGNDNDNATALVVNPDGTVVIAGESFSESNDVTCRNPGICESDFWIVKSAADGTILWAKCYGSMYSGTNFTNRPQSIIRTTDGGYMVVGKGRDNNTDLSFGLADIWALKLDANGDLQWRQNYGGPEDEIGYAVRQTADGGYVIAGSSMSNDGQVSVDFSSTYLSSMRNGWIIKIGADGALQWQKAVGSDYEFDQLNDIVETAPGEYIAVGLPGLSSNNHTANSAGRRFWILRLSSSLSTGDVVDKSLHIYPNPAETVLFIDSKNPVKEVRIYDTGGRKVGTFTHDAITSIDLSAYIPGIYFIEVENALGVAVRKLVKR